MFDCSRFKPEHDLLLDLRASFQTAVIQAGVQLTHKAESCRALQQLQDSAGSSRQHAPCLQ
jgi:hypothetical protein